MTDPIFYLSLLLGLGGVYVLISSFHDDDDDDNDGEKFTYNLEYINSAGQFLFYKEIIFKVGGLKDSIRKNFKKYNKYYFIFCNNPLDYIHF